MLAALCFALFSSRVAFRSCIATVEGIQCLVYLGSIFSAFKYFAAIFCLVLLKSCQGSFLCVLRRCGTVSMVKLGSFKLPVSSFHAKGVETVAPSRALA